MIRAHGTCVEIDGSGVLLRGPSGSGKSDLALRLIDGGARLVADLVAPAAVERMPEERTCRYLGRAVPLIAVAPFEASAPAKLRFALRALAPARAACPA